MGQSVEVVVSDMNAAAARLADAGQRLQDGLSSVDQETEQLLGSGWKGQAASAYGPAWQQWHDGAQQVVQGLQRMSELLTVAAKEYAKTDESASGALGSTMQGGGGGSSGGGAGAAGAGAAGAGASSAGSGGAQAGAAGGAGDMAQQMNLGQAMSSVSQLAGQMAQAVTQAGQQGVQAAGGLAGQLGQLAAQIAEQAVQAAEAGAEGDAKHDGGEDGQGEHPDASTSSSDRAPVDQRATPSGDPTGRRA